MKKISISLILCFILSSCNSGGLQNNAPKNLSQQNINGNPLVGSSILDLCVLNKTTSDITLNGNDKSYLFVDWRDREGNIESMIYLKISAAQQSLKNQIIKPNNTPECVAIVLPKINVIADDNKKVSFLDNPFSISVRKSLQPINFSPNIKLFGKRGEILSKYQDYEAADYNNINDITYKGQDMTVVLKASSNKSINIVVTD